MTPTGTAELRAVSLRCPSDLTPQSLEWLTDGLAAALPSLRMRGLFQARVDMFSEADLITVVLAGDTVVGALASRWCALDSGTRFLHVTAQFVADAYRHGGVFRQSWRSHFAGILESGHEFPGLFALKTYNPVVYCAMRTFAAAPGTIFYPGTDEPASGVPAVPVAEIARVVAPGRPFQPATGVIASAGSPADLYAEMPLSRDEAVNAYFARSLRPGDRILCVLGVQPEGGGAAMIQRAFGLGDRDA